ncbi:hypothetical protein J4467_03030 [Candidatus Woesearchaeota archaeon]|nr:hypothetical protein [Candidatus Woesearchaeota archaeon]
MKLEKSFFNNYSNFLREIRTGSIFLFEQQARDYLTIARDIVKDLNN